MLPCTICGKPLSNNFSLNRHVRTVHEGKKEHAPKSLLCESCGKAFTFPSSLAKHKKGRCKINKEASLLCEYCGKSFSDPRNLWRHKKYRCKRAIMHNNDMDAQVKIKILLYD